MSLLDLNVASTVVEELNKQIKYQVSGGVNVPMYLIKNFIAINSDGENHAIYFLGSKLWSTDQEKNLENVPAELEIELNTKENFESFLRSLIQAEVNAISHIDLTSKG